METKICNLIKIIILAIIEGITEWLPISSTGHMIIVEKYLNVKKLFNNLNFYDLFIVVIQLGAVCAVIIKYFNLLNPLNKNNKKEKYLNWIYIIITTIPAAILGFLLDDLIFEKLFNNVVVSIMLIAYGIIFLFIDKITFKKRTLNFKTALLIGFFQILSLVPGTSRSGIMIIVGIILLGDKVLSTEYSFMCSIPIILGASLLKTIKYLNNNKIILNDLILLLIGMIISFIISKIVLDKLIKFVKNKSLKSFGIYRIILGIIILLTLIF